MKKILWLVFYLLLIGIAILFIARYYSDERKWESIHKSLIEAVDINPRDANTYASLGRLYEFSPKGKRLTAQKDLERSIKLYQKALELDSGNPKALFSLAVIYDRFRMVPVKQLLQLYQDYLKNETEPGERNVQIAQSRVKLIEALIASRAKDRIYEKTQTGNRVWVPSFDQRQALQEIKPTSNRFKPKKDPEAFAFFMDRAFSFLKKGQTDEAERQFVSALLVNPDTLESTVRINEYANLKIDSNQTRPESSTMTEQSTAQAVS